MFLNKIGKCERDMKSIVEKNSIDYISLRISELELETPEWSEIIIDIYDLYRCELKPNKYLELIMNCLFYDRSLTNNKRELRKLIDYEDFEEKIIRTIEQMPAYRYTIIDRLGYSKSDVEVVLEKNDNNAIID